MPSSPSARTQRPAGPRSRLAQFEAALAAAFVVAFVVWTVLVLHGALAGFDAGLQPPTLAPRSVPGQIAEAFSLLTHPFLIEIAIVVAAVLALQQRMRRLALALGIGAAGIVVQIVLSFTLGVERPATAFADSISHVGGAYPASHVTALTLGAWVLVTLTRARRRGPTSIVAWALTGVGVVLLTALAQWAMGLIRVSDIIGGLLLGGAFANLGLTLGGIDPILAGWAHLGLPEGTVSKRAAVILNPTKFDDLSLLRRRVEAETLRAGWQPSLWLETTPDDPGREAARRALAAQADVVLIAGGDGTVRVVCAELAGSGTPVALIPSGTGNLLARNLGVPLDTDSALRLALNGRARSIDVVRCAWDDGEDRFVVMAGLGLDAQIMDSTNDDLKKVIRSGAYAVAAVQNAVPDPFTVTVTLDDGEPQEHDVVMALLGNVGTITGGMTLFADATPDDGEVDLMLASPERVTDWAKLGAQILIGKEMEGFETTSARRIEITSASPVPFELDGDTEGETSTLVAEVEPGALLVVAPAR